METLFTPMTKEELAQIIEAFIEQKSLKLFDDFDDAELKPEVESHLMRQKRITQFNNSIWVKRDG